MVETIGNDRTEDIRGAFIAVPFHFYDSASRIMTDDFFFNTSVHICMTTLDFQFDSNFILYLRKSINRSILLNLRHSVYVRFVNEVPRDLRYAPDLPEVSL